MLIQIKALHLYDCLRANKSTSAWGVEARVPFLDKEFINIAMNIDPEWKMVNASPLKFLTHPHATTKTRLTKTKKEKEILFLLQGTRGLKLDLT